MRQKSAQKRRYGMIAAVGLLVFVFLILAYGLVSKNEREKPPEATVLTINQERIYARALGEYFCPCGACSELFSDCTCPTALKVKKEARKRLREENASYEDIAWMLENVYKARKKT